MEETPVFFGEEGLTETSANHIANLAKEIIKKEEADISSISFINKQVSLLNEPKGAAISIGWEEEECKGIAQKLQHIMKFKSLIAWLREAIKEKKKLHDNVDSTEQRNFFIEWAQTHKVDEGIEAPLNEETYLNSLSIGERFKIFKLQTEAAVIGKAIHESGALSKARAEMHKVKKTPSEVVRSGVNNLLYLYEPSLNEEIVDEVYFELQKQHRSIQSELNSYLNKMNEAIRQSEIEYHHRKTEIVELKLDNDNLMRISWREVSKKRHKEISNLKIVIPNSLREVYEEIQNVG